MKQLIGDIKCEICLDSGYYWNGSIFVKCRCSSENKRTSRKRKLNDKNRGDGNSSGYGDIEKGKDIS